MVELRPYQTDLVGRTAAAYRAGHRRVLVQLPTGGGKGRLLGRFGAGAAAKGRRVLAVAHRSELVDQISANLLDEGVRHGRVQSGFEPSAEMISVGMIQSVCLRLAALPPPDFLLIDEAHHATAGQYQLLAKAWPKAKTLGVSATPIRTDGKGLRSAFDELIEGPSTRDLIEAGFLAAYDYYEPEGFDASGLRVRAGEFVQSDALEAVQHASITGSAVEQYLEHLRGRPAIAFTINVEQAEIVARSFRDAGIPAAHVDGTMPLEERRRRLAALASGELWVITAADVISEGVDIPAVAGAILLRPTASLALFLQQVGRVLRPKMDGSRAVILDHVGNALRHGYPADPRRWTLDGVDRRVVAAARCSMIGAGGAGAIRVAPEHVDGRLRLASDPWAWAGGIDPARASGHELGALIDRAATIDQLRLVANVRGYRRGWATHVLRDRARVAV